jgi:hypothetical protein
MHGRQWQEEREHQEERNNRRSGNNRISGNNKSQNASCKTARSAEEEKTIFDFYFFQDNIV